MNFTSEVKVLCSSENEEEGHNGQLDDLRAWAKHPGEASSSFAMPPRAGVCPCMETWCEGGGDRWQAGRQTAAGVEHCSNLTRHFSPPFSPGFAKQHHDRL